ncbi:MAG: quinone-dependent dihydroorotate dehydrogenase [Planctomycetota bacterium]
MLWQSLARPLLFCLPAERAHYFSMGAFQMLMSSKWAVKQYRRRNEVNDSRLQSEVFGLTFRNPVGLAAGFDKDARWYSILPALGFGHVEVGTLTGQSQAGNPKPRLFRLPKDHAIINRMGFNNRGSDAAARRLASSSKSDPGDILGVNIGKTKIIPLEEAVSDYLFSFERLFAFADYFTVNVSSPNTPGLRQLQSRDPLLDLLTRIKALNLKLANDHEVPPKPVLLKIAPDLSDELLADIVSIVKEIRPDGIIATNTTIGRDGLVTPGSKIDAIGNGGLSGAPLTAISRQVVETLYRELDGQTPIIGLGGIMDGESAWKMICAGASLIQTYTGFIYGGPKFVRDINRYLVQKIQDAGMESIADAVGSAT